MLLLLQNLLSISFFTNSIQVSNEFFSDYFLIKDLEMRVALHKGPNNRGLYSLQILKSFSSPAIYATSLDVWHALLAHASYPTIY